MNFESYLKKGHFYVPECKECKTVIWPPTNTCSNCFAKVEWRKAKNIGKLLEFSKKKNNHFCLVEFENLVKIMGTLQFEPDQNPQVGQQVKLEECGIRNGTHYFILKLI